MGSGKYAFKGTDSFPIIGYVDYVLRNNPEKIGQNKNVDPEYWKSYLPKSILLAGYAVVSAVAIGKSLEALIN